jgi:hypothetical protein
MACSMSPMPVSPTRGGSAPPPWIERLGNGCGLAYLLDDPVALVLLDDLFDVREYMGVARGDREPGSMLPHALVLAGAQRDPLRAGVLRALTEIASSSYGTQSSR